MNMNKALQNLYHAVSGSTTTKVNISKLLVDIHYAITGKESENKNNWSKIINSMADNWPEGGGGSSGFSTASVRIYNIAENSEWSINGISYDDGNTEIIGGLLVDDACFAERSYTVGEFYDETFSFILFKPLQLFFSGPSSLLATGDCTVEYDSSEEVWIATISGDATLHEW